ncbi:MAG TPA: EAL domain-containing protein, partial [Planctomycetota bacterium]|nr:EAL domain-containing protein [Planctomycetota bacterium]
GCVLFVDDEPQVLLAVRRALYRQRYEILTAGCAEEAMEIVRGREVDVVVSDQQMPGVRGSALLGQIRKERPDTVRILLTGASNVEDLARAVNVGGISRFLRKPCGAVELAASIAQALEERDARRRFERWRSSFHGRDEGELRPLFERVLEGAWMAFQPIVNAADGSLFGYEALLRTSDVVVRGPGQVFDLAHALGAVADVDAHAQRLIAARMAELPDGASLLVNVHPRTIETGRLDEVSAPLRGMAGRVVLEVTEQASYADVPELAEQVAAVRARGFRVALDDLGSGYAGLTAFAALLPDLVKFDMALIQGLEGNVAMSKLVGAMGKLCGELGIRTVAEGIETETQQRLSAELGCDLLQGYHLGRPDARFLPPCGVDRLAA